MRRKTEGETGLGFMRENSGRARESGISVLLVEQNVRVAVAFADRAYVLDDGRVVYEGSAAELAMDEERVRALAGASAKEWA